MAILQGGKINFTGGSDQYIAAFCMDRKRHAPPEGNPFNNYVGKVELTFKSGEKRTYDLGVTEQRAEAFKYFHVDGTARHYSLKFLQADPSLQSIELLSTAVAHTGSDEDFGGTLENLSTLEEFTANLPPATSTNRLPASTSDNQYAAQTKFWNSPYKITRVPRKSVTYDYKKRNPAQSAVQQIINLDGRGDAILVRYADLNLLIDTGLSTEAFIRIATKLPKNIRLHLILTHRDQDHIGNVTRLLRESEKAGLVIENIIISSYQVPPFDKRTESTRVVQQFLEELEKHQYKRNDLSSQLTAFAKGASLPIVAQAPHGLRNVIRESKKDLQNNALLSKFLTPSQKTQLLELDDVPRTEVFELSLSRDVQLSVVQKRGPTSPNESSLVTKLVHNGRSTLYTGDINENVMDDLLAESSLAHRERLLTAIPIALSYLKEKHPSEFLRLTQSVGPSTSPNAAFAILDEVGSRVLANDAAWRQRLDEASQPTFSLAANVLKWPHHAWLPKSEKGRQTLRRFIEAVHPDTILFSVAPESADVKFSPAEFADADGFVTRLKTARDPFSSWLLGQFSDSTRQQVNANNVQGVTGQFKQQLAQELTRLIQGPLIYREDLFAGVDLTGIRSLTANITDAERPFINRELLERAYLNEIGEVRGQNMEKVKNYLRQYLPDRNFNIVVTARDGDIELRTKNDFRQQNEFVPERVH